MNSLHTDHGAEMVDFTLLTLVPTWRKTPKAAALLKFYSVLVASVELGK